MKTKTGYITDGTYIKFKSGFTQDFCVETEDRIEWFKNEKEADDYILIFTKKKEPMHKIDDVLPCVRKLTADIIKYFPKFFDDFANFEYGTGIDAGKDFKKIFNKAKKLNKMVSGNYR